MSTLNQPTGMESIEARVAWTTDALSAETGDPAVRPIDGWDPVPRPHFTDTPPEPVRKDMQIPIPAGHIALQGATAQQTHPQ